MNKKFLVSATTAVLVASAVVPAASAANFKDVTADNGHKKAIETLAGLNIVSGYEDGTFKPNLQLKRAHVVKMLGKWLVSQGHSVPADYKTKPRFTDLATTHPDQELVKYAALVYDTGVFTGNQKKLNAQDSMRRDQMALVLTRAIKTVYKEDVVAAAQAVNFKSGITDIATLPADKKQAIEALSYINVTTVKAYKPLNTMTRAQFATFLYNTLQAQNKPSITAIKVVDKRTLQVTLSDKTTHKIALGSDLPENKSVNIPIEVNGKPYQVDVTYKPEAPTPKPPVEEAFAVKTIVQSSVTEVEVNFTKPLKSSNLENRTIQLRNETDYKTEQLANIEIINDGLTLKITTKTPLIEGKTYEVYAKELADYTGKAIDVQQKFVGQKDDNAPRIAGWENIGSDRVKVNFTKPVQSVKSANYRLTAGDVVLGVDMKALANDGKSIVFDFSKATVNGQKIRLGSDVIIQLKDVLDKAGNTMAEKNTAVQIKTRQPDGEKPTLAKAEQIVPKTIKLTFSEPILRADQNLVEILVGNEAVGFDYEADANDPKVYYYTLKQAVGGDVTIKTQEDKNIVDYTGEINTFTKVVTLSYISTAPTVSNVHVEKINGNEYLVFTLPSGLKGIEQGAASFSGNRIDSANQSTQVTSKERFIEPTANKDEYRVSLGGMFANTPDPENVKYQGNLQISYVTSEYDVPVRVEPVTFTRTMDAVNSKYQIKLNSDLQYAVETHTNSASTVTNDSYIRVNFDAPVDPNSVTLANFTLYDGEIDRVVVDDKNSYAVLVYFKNVASGANRLDISNVKAKGSNVAMEKEQVSLQLNAYKTDAPTPEASNVTVEGKVVSDVEVQLTFSEAIDAVTADQLELFVNGTKYATTVALLEDGTVASLKVNAAGMKLLSQKADVTFSVKDVKDKDGKIITVTKQHVAKDY